MPPSECAGNQLDVAEPNIRREIAGLLPDLRAFARFLVRDRVVADDIVQDSIVRALAAIDQFQPGTNLKAWLFTILRNQFYEQGRRRKREINAMRSQLDAEHAVDPAQHARAEITDLQQLIWRLPPLLREALILVGAQEMSHEEAAAICNVPVGTMKARLSRARSSLAKLMAEATSRPS